MYSYNTHRVILETKQSFLFYGTFFPFEDDKGKKKKEKQENIKTSNNKQVERGNPWQQLKLWL